MIACSLKLAITSSPIATIALSKLFAGLFWMKESLKSCLTLIFPLGTLAIAYEILILERDVPVGQSMGSGHALVVGAVLVKADHCSEQGRR